MAPAQSSDSVLWIGTLDGVASFDGKSITPIPGEPGAPLRGVITTIVPRTGGGATLHVSWRDGRARFEVEDTGPGIAPAELGQLFEPFVQSETGQRSKEGTGLGLALSRNLARLMDGDITVTSTPGVGSRFCVEIRLQVAVATPPEAVEERRVTALAPGHEGIRVLVVDDTPINRAVLTRLLSQVGFEVREASGGEEALASWRSWKPDAIWMDKRMPGLDGLEVTRRIRAEEQSSGGHVPIIALSASALDYERGEILNAGCDDFVAKPFHEATIFAKLREHLGVSYVYEDDDVSSAPHAAVVANSVSEDAHILLVDDDWICREVAVEMLRVNGVGVTAASSGREALALLQTMRFDLVLMDLQMPDMGGIETARRIKADPETAKLSVIAMSADTFDGEPARLAESGMDDCVAKPVEPEVLAEVLGRWLGARRTA